jgi:hypothetical protein
MRGVVVGPGDPPYERALRAVVMGVHGPRGEGRREKGVDSGGGRAARDPGRYQIAARARVEVLRMGWAWFTSLTRRVTDGSGFPR